MDPGSWSNKVSSLFLNVSFLLQFTTHLMLAMERLFIMRQIPEEASTVYFQRLLVAVSVPLLILIGISLAFRSLEGTPLDSFPIKLWTVAMTTVYVGCTTWNHCPICADIRYIQHTSQSRHRCKIKINSRKRRIGRIRVQTESIRDGNDAVTCAAQNSVYMHHHEQCSDDIVCRVYDVHGVVCVGVFGLWRRAGPSDVCFVSDDGECVAGTGYGGDAVAGC
ncbi:hypothetical protein BJ741DRAFT_614846 [Chytriomyces cf. hyalinus JEL632]|nr:hypothetical protein BJ741DRAFT_614846 [Chytriomyces cf. hyalinus JEL632]